MKWFHKILPNTPILGSKSQKIPEGLWLKCSNCHQILYRSDLEKYEYVCHHCNHHQKISARNRLKNFLDKNSTQELFDNLYPLDPLRFQDSKRYTDRLTNAQKQTQENDALIVYKGKLLDIQVVACAFEFDFMGGSMGSVVGEKFVRAAKHCLENKSPFICFSSSGGARMQEGMISLMQMAKTATIIKQLAENKIPYISVLTNPTMGGVSASFAMLGDIIIAEPEAVIGFAGKRVIEDIVKQKLPDDFQTAEFLLKHGSIDLTVHRKKMRKTIHSILKILLNEHNIESLEYFPDRN